MIPTGGDPGPKYLEGLRHLQMDEYEEAVEAFSEAISIKGTHVLAYKRRAEAYGYLGKKDEEEADRNYADYLEYQGPFGPSSKADSDSMESEPVQRSSTPTPTRKGATKTTFCRHCGSENRSDALRCQNCRKSLSIYQAAAHVESRPHIPNYLTQSILVTIFCCVPAGIVSIVYAARVNGKVGRGDYEGARRLSNNAKTWAWVSFGLGLAGGVLSFLASAAGA